MKNLFNEITLILTFFALENNLLDDASELPTPDFLAAEIAKTLQTASDHFLDIHTELDSIG